MGRYRTGVRRNIMVDEDVDEELRRLLRKQHAVERDEDLPYGAIKQAVNDALRDWIQARQ